MIGDFDFGPCRRCGARPTRLDVNDGTWTLGCPCGVRNVLVVTDRDPGPEAPVNARLALAFVELTGIVGGLLDRVARLEAGR